MSCVEFTVNGKKCTVTNNIPREMSLNAYIRYVLALPGTKAMCREGGCGSCIVTVRARRLPSDRIETFSVNTCLVLVLSCHGWDITTIEGLGNRRDGYHDIQKRMAAFNATQCGYCTPGWVMALNSLVDKHLTMAELERSFGSNTCRCTGFRPILDTIKSFAVDASPELCEQVQDIEDLYPCTKKKSCHRNCSVTSLDSSWSELEDFRSVTETETISLDFGVKKFFKVFDENEIFNILDVHGADSYMFIDGNTAKGLLENYLYPHVLIDISDVKSLKYYSFDQNLILGANISLEDCITIFKQTAKTNSDFAYLKEFADHFELVAHIPVRKIGSLAGNLVSKNLKPSYQSDIFLLFSAVGAMILVRHGNGTKKLLSMADFLNYNLEGVLLLNIELPPLSRYHIFKSYKIMPRHQNALAIVNAAFLIKLNPETDIIEDVSIAYGNITPDFIYAAETEKFLQGKNVFNNETLQGAIQLLAKEINPIDMPPEPSPECRKKLAIGLFYKFILSICPNSFLSPIYRSGGSTLNRPLSHGIQEFQTNEELYPLNKPMPKLEALIQSSGEAQYANDIPPIPHEVFGAFVLATVCCGEVEKIDSSEILKIDGVIALYTADDIPGKNSFTKVGYPLETEDEEILATNAIKYYGQPIAIVVAESEELAAHIATLVRVTYKNTSSKPPILTIDEGKKDTKTYLSGPSMTPQGKGDNVKKVIKGVYEIEAQYHYYLEPITSVVVPVDKGYEVYDSTQWMDLSQTAVAQCLDINESQVLVRVRRIGGAFGGKLSRGVQATAACALVASKLDRACRFILPMQTNMTIAGKRLPCQCEYEVGVDENGKIQYLNADITEDDGCTHNENILDYTLQGFPNCYNTEYFDVKTAAILTNLPSNTFARAPGTAEGIACIEHIMEHIAFAVQKDPTDVRIINMRSNDNDIPELINVLKKDANYDERVKEIQEFNHANRWKKKAIKISVMLFPVIFYGNYTAMVSIYRGDGTVTVTTGGIEMGQGVNTKAAQVCAYELGIPVEHVSILPNYSFVAANNVFSGSSIVSESVCYSIIKACEILKKRLEPIKEKMSNPSWKELIKQAGEDEIDLTAEYMMTDTEKDLEAYSAFAVVILETELDVLTGRYEILRADILEDVGLSANPTLDIGQVEGAYVQGLGYYTSEKLVYDNKSGRLLTNRSLNYHVPLALDIPADFRVKLRYNSKNPKGVLGSKDTPFDTESILKALDVKFEEMILTECS